MRIGFLIPTYLEAENLPGDEGWACSAGYGPGKAAACAAAASLVYEKNCDAIIVWGAAGALSERFTVGDIVVAERVAYKDFDIAPLCGSDGVGFVPDYAEGGWVELDGRLNCAIARALASTFPGRKIGLGAVCTGDVFTVHHSRDTYNRIENAADLVDMESAAVVEFCRKIGMHDGREIRCAVIRAVSDNAAHDADMKFSAFMKILHAMNGSLEKLRRSIMAELEA